MIMYQIRAPKALETLMSAVKKESCDDKQDSQYRVHNFEQKVPIPSYLIAIVVGALQSK